MRPEQVLIRPLQPMTTQLPQLTVDDKVLLHLSQFILTSEDPEAPLESTQEGIAEAAGINATHVPRSVQNLRRKGYLDEFKLPVAGSDRRRKAYACTEEGQRRAHRLRADLAEAQILVRGEDGRIDVTSVRQLYGKTVTVRQMLEVVRRAMPTMMVDLPDVGALVPAGASPMAAHLYTSIPSVSSFYGRRDEVKVFQAALKDPQVRMIAVTGIAGIGKTSLVAKALERYRRVPVFWYRLHEWETLRNIGFVMADFLADLDRPDLRSYMQGNREHDVAEALEIVNRDLEGVEAVVVLDDFDKAPRNFMGFIRSFLPQLDRFTGIKFVVVTRTSVPMFSETDRVERRVVEITLAGLHEADARRLIGSRANADLVAHVTRVTEGHPLLLKLFLSAPEEDDGPRLATGAPTMTDDGAVAQARDAETDLALDDAARERLWQSEGIHRFLTEEILATLGQAEKRALEAASVHRYPVPPEVLFVDDDIDFDAIDALRRRLLLRTVGGRFVEPMDFVREFVYKRLKPDERRHLHEQAAKVIRDVGVPGTGWMVPQHLLAAGRTDEAVASFLEVAPRYLEKGKTEELAALVRDLLDIDDLSKEQYTGLATMRAEVYDRAGDDERAVHWRGLAAKPPRRRKVGTSRAR